MKKVLLFLGHVLLFSSFAYSQQLTESFEQNTFPPAGWNAVTVKGVPWTVSKRKAFTGGQSAYKEYELVSNGYNGDGESWLISPKIYQIKNGDKVTFYLASAYEDNIPLPYYDSMIVYISETGNQPADFTTPIAKLDLNVLTVDFTKFEYAIPAQFVGKNIHVAFHHLEKEGNSVFLDAFSAGSKLTNDLGSHALNLKGDWVVSTGTTINITDTLINNGTSIIPSNVPVSYSVNNGPLKTVETSASLNPGGKTYVTFSGANAFQASASGTYTIKVFANWPADLNQSNDTITYKLIVQDPHTAYPYFTDFTNLTDWTQAGNIPFEITAETKNSTISTPITDPTGVQSKVAVAQTYEYQRDSFMLRTPLLDFSAVANPMLNFYVAAGNWRTYNDTLQILISMDGGLSFEPAVYRKSYKTSSRLQTFYQSASETITFFTPDKPSSWRHEIVDLSKYAGNPNIMIAFNVKANSGNNIYLDNIKIFDQPKALYSASRVTAAGADVTGPMGSKVHFVTLSAADSIRFQAHNVMAGDPNFIYNDGATSNNGKVTTPNLVFPRYWTIAYSGNSDVRATYNISLDVTGIPGVTASNLDSLYIMKRADESGAWESLTTKRLGNVLTASGLTYFSDFAIGYFSTAVPVTVLQFGGKVVSRVIELGWNTSQEANILSYDIQKWNGADWITIGNRESLRISMQNDYAFTDMNPSVGINLYRLKIYSEMGSVTYSDVAKVMYALSENKVYQNVPNPVKAYTMIPYELAKTAHVKVVVFDSHGRQMQILENGIRPAGYYQARWDAANLPSGTYYYQVIIDNEAISKPMLKLK